MRDRRSSRSLSAAAILLVAVSVIGAVEHQVSVRSAVADLAMSAADRQHAQATHLDPVAAHFHDCVVCRLGSPSLAITTRVGAPVVRFTETIPGVARSLSPLCRFETSQSRAPPVS